MSLWTDKRITVTGAHGFLGRNLVAQLRETRAVKDGQVFTFRSNEADLRVLADARRVVAGSDIVLHLAADVGGLGYSSRHPASQYVNCTLIDVNVYEACRLEAVPRLVAVSSSTAYGSGAAMPLQEDALFDGKPAASHVGYGMAKRGPVVLSEIFHRQYGMAVATAILGNAYGPWDDFDRETAHVIPATIRKCFEEPSLIVWGDGTAIREFVYARDAAEGILKVAERLNSGEAVNIGSSQEITVRQLVETITTLTGFRGPITWDTTKPGGDARRVMDGDRAAKLLDYRAEYSLERGLRATIDWYVGVCQGDIRA